MKKNRKLKLLFVVPLIAFIFSSVFVNAISCRDILKTENVVTANRADIIKDYEALEVIASLTLALEILGGRYTSIPRIKYNERNDYLFDSYDFDRISKADKNEIINDLPKRIQNILKKSNILGKNFYKTFEKDFIEGLLIRNRTWSKEFFEENFKAIVFNAVTMPKLPIKEKLVLFAKRNAKVSVPISLAIGSLVEFIYPSMLFDQFYKENLQTSIDYAFALKAAINAAPIYMTFSSLQIGKIVAEKEIFNLTEYDFELGRQIREDFVDVTFKN